MISKSHPNLRWNLRRLVARSEVSFANLQAVGLQGDRSTSQAAHLEDQRHRERRRLQRNVGCWVKPWKNMEKPTKNVGKVGIF